MDKESKELMKIYHKLYAAELKYSIHTEKFYISANIEITDGVLSRSICEHRETPEEAVHAFHQRVLQIV